MRRGLTLGRVAGIPIVMDFSMVLFTVVIVASGGNADPALFAEILETAA